MSVGRVTTSGGQRFDMEGYNRFGLELSDLAAFIREGNEIEVMDPAGDDITKTTLIDIALSTSRVANTESARQRLMQEDEFRLYQLIEDEGVADFLGL